MTEEQNGTLDMHDLLVPDDERNKMRVLQF